MVAWRARRAGVDHHLIGGVRARVERRGRPEEEPDDRRADGDRHVHRAGIAGDERRRAAEHGPELADAGPSARVDRRLTDPRDDAVAEGTIAAAADHHHAQARRRERAAERDERRLGPLTDRPARPELQRDDAIVATDAARGEQRRRLGFRRRPHVVAQPARVGELPCHRAVVVDEIEARDPAIQAHGREQTRPRMTNQTQAVGRHRPAAHVRNAEQPHEHGAHARARVVEREVEALGPQMLDHVLDVAIRLEEVRTALEHQPAEPVELDAVDAVDPGDVVAHVGEVLLGHQGDGRRRMAPLQRRDRGRRLQEVAESRQVDDQNALGGPRLRRPPPPCCHALVRRHSRCSRR